jgi:hypothetical protein
MERDDVTFNVGVAPPGAGGLGGGIDSPGAITLDDSEIVDNQASQKGGGFLGLGDLDVSLSRDLVDGNVVQDATQPGMGGGILMLEGTVTDDTIAGNVVTDGS